jgi:predicted nucleic acid-binding protein
LNLYLDACVVVSQIINDAFSLRADAFLRAHMPTMIVSDFAAAEFASVIARYVRMRTLTQPAARIVFMQFDTWLQGTERAETIHADVATAERALRRLDMNLRAPDALNIAIAQRIGATLMTFDDKMAACAKALGVPVAAA